MCLPSFDQEDILCRFLSSFFFFLHRITALFQQSHNNMKWRALPVFFTNSKTTVENKGDGMGLSTKKIEQFRLNKQFSYSLKPVTIL